MDEIIWSVTDSGEFSLKSAIVQNQSMYPAPWLEMIWFDGRFQKHALCLWMDIQKGLKTRALLASRNIISDTTCALCGGNQEDIQHIMNYERLLFQHLYLVRNCGQSQCLFAASI